MNFDNDDPFDDLDDCDESDNSRVVRRIGRVEYDLMTNLDQSDVPLYQKTMDLYPEIPLVLVDSPISVRCHLKQGASFWVRSDYGRDMSAFWATMRQLESKSKGT